MTNAELAILSLVVEKSRYGYEIEQVIERRGMRAWTEIGFSSIYFQLKKLETAGWIESRLEAAAGKGPARRIYTVTPAGQEAWHAAVLAALSEPQTCFMPIQLGLSNWPGLALEEAAAALQLYRQRLAERLTQVQANWQAQQPLPSYVDAQFEHSLALIRAELDWLDQYLARI